jgi:hypothetical protein
METWKSLDSRLKPIIKALLCDAQALHSDVFTHRALKLTYRKVCERLDSEGIGFLTKTMPRLGKALDRALSSNDPLSVPYERKLKGTQLPRFLGELFSLVFDNDGRVLPTPCVASIKTLRNVLYAMYKLRISYSSDQEQDVINSFIKTEDEVRLANIRLESLNNSLSNPLDRSPDNVGVERARLVRRARTLLARVLCSFDPLDVVPGHGPGVVSTRERYWNKYTFTAIPTRITDVFPIDTYFYVSLSHVCDRLHVLTGHGETESPARVILVPKDSRGPRLISCEPLYLQWLQQGVSRALVRHVESHRLTTRRVNFTDQGPNRIGALLGSVSGKYSTLDLNEASDRVSLGLVRLLFPSNIVNVLEAIRSQNTELPNGRILPLHKHAPMGSALCFPILSLTVWAILNAAASDADTRERILVYGDDVIVPTAFAARAMSELEYYGLKINRSKSCVDGLFRESCGMDAYKGIDVTPTRLRVPPTSHPEPDHYEAWISYANSYYHKGFFNVYDCIVAELVRLYGPIPHSGMSLTCPSLVEESLRSSEIRRRNNRFLQKMQYYVRCVKGRVVRKDIDGWSMLLRYFTEKCRNHSNTSKAHSTFGQMPIGTRPAFDDYIDVDTGSSVREYTQRNTNKFVFRWQ